jgi:mannonate dehydratase
MEPTWRWFGPKDPVRLEDARQAGAHGIVTALHDHPPGAVWEVEKIRERRDIIAGAGLRWSVVESVHVSEEIKTRGALWRRHIDAYKDTLRNLAGCGIATVCYNFMPVLDWTRTDLAWRMPDGALALRYDDVSFAAFDLFILRRKGAADEWTEDRQRAAHGLFQKMTEAERDQLTRNVLAGLPGTDTGYSLENIRDALARYEGVETAAARQNLGDFLRAVCPVAEELGLRLCIHPDDPPHRLLGLPRVVSTASDLEFILNQTPEPSNGITFCTGSLGVLATNDLPAMARAFAHRIRFAHLRSTKHDADISESFVEAPHLEGDVDMVSVIAILLAEERRRKAAGDSIPLPFRADHGQQILHDQHTRTQPGYPAIGRLKGLAELRGVMLALESRALHQSSDRKDHIE